MYKLDFLKEGDKRGKIPFALVAVVLLILSTLSFALLARVEHFSAETAIYTPDNEATKVEEETRDDISSRAYHIALSEIYKLTKNRDPDLSKLQPAVKDKLKQYINNKYPIERKDCIVYIDNWTLNIVTDSRTDMVSEPWHDRVSEFPPPDQSQYKKQVDNTESTLYHEMNSPLYGRVVGELETSIYSLPANRNITFKREYDRNIYSPLFYLKSRFEEFQTGCKNPSGGVGELVRYQLSTISQVRSLFGYAAGGYTSTDPPLEEVITEKDVEIALNLALLLEATRLYGDFDEDNSNQMGITSMLEQYAKSGTIDASDLFAAHRNLKSEDVNAGKVLGQAIYPFGEDFVLALYELFWGDEMVDPTLSEPVVNWDEVKNKGEDWATKKVRTFLSKFRDWLGIPADLPQRQGFTTISTMENDFDGLHIESYNPPVIVPFGGTYYTFSMGPNMFNDAHWSVKSHEISNTTNLIMGRGSDPELDPKPYTLETWSDIISVFEGYVGTKEYKYQLVKESFIAKHDTGAGHPYFDSLKYVLEVINRSIRHRSSSASGPKVEKGYMDLMAYDTSGHVGQSSNGLSYDPEDKKSVVVDGTEKLVKNGGQLDQGLNTYESYAGDFSKREEWWLDGAYKRQMSPSEDYMFDLTKEVVNLWYEAVVNLYEGGSSNTKENPADSPPSNYDFPKTEQVSDGKVGSGETEHTNQMGGDFEFRQDMRRDAFARVMNVVEYRRDSPGPWFYCPTELAWETDYGDPCWMCPLCIMTIIEIHNTVKNEWTDQTIWDRIWDGEDEVKKATDMVVRTDDMMGGLAMSGIDKMLYEHMNQVTDQGSYKSNFDDWVIEYIGVVIIGDGHNSDCMTTKLSKDGGWLQTMFRKRMLNDIHRKIGVWDEEAFLATNTTMPKWSWRDNWTFDRKHQAVLNETYYVDFVSYLGSSKLNIDIQYPDEGQHFVDVQDRYQHDPELKTSMGWSPFQANFKVSVSGDAKLDLTTSRHHIPEKVHKRTQYKGTLHIDLNMSIPVYTSWPLESDWRTGDVDYDMMRGYFGLVGKDYHDTRTPLLDACYLSKPFMKMSRAMSDSLAQGTNAMFGLNHHLTGMPHSSVGRAQHTSSNVTSLMNSIHKSTKEVSSDSGYFTYIDRQRNKMSGENQRSTSVFEYPYLGFNTKYDISSSLQPTYMANRTELEYELSSGQYSYEGKKRGNLKIDITSDSSATDVKTIRNTPLDKFTWQLSYPPSSESLSTTKLSDSHSKFTSISLPAAGDGFSIDVIIQSRGGSVGSASSWFDTAAKEKWNNTYEGFVRVTKKTLRQMHESPSSVSGVDQLEIRFKLWKNGEEYLTEGYATNMTSSDAEVRKFARLMINNLRAICRNLGRPQPSSAVLTRVSVEDLNNYQFTVTDDRQNYTLGNFAWWASQEPEIGTGRRADFFYAEIGRIKRGSLKKYGKEVGREQ